MEYLSSSPCNVANGAKSSLMKATDCCHSGLSVFGWTVVLKVLLPNDILQYGSDFPLVSAAVKLRAFNTTKNNNHV